MPRFRRRTFDYEAVQYTGANLPEIIELYGRGSTFGVEVRVLEGGCIRLKPPGGGFGFHDIRPGMWLIRSADGELSVSPDETFRRDFEGGGSGVRAMTSEEMQHRIDVYIAGGRLRQAFNPLAPSPNEKLP